MWLAGRKSFQRKQISDCCSTIWTFFSYILLSMSLRFCGFQHPQKWKSSKKRKNYFINPLSIKKIFFCIFISSARGQSSKNSNKHLIKATLAIGSNIIPFFLSCLQCMLRWLLFRMKRMNKRKTKWRRTKNKRWNVETKCCILRQNMKSKTHYFGCGFILSCNFAIVTRGKIFQKHNINNVFRWLHR